MLLYYGLMLQLLEAETYRQYSSGIPPVGHDQVCMNTYGRFVSKGGFHWEQVVSEPAFHIITSGSGSFVSNGISHHATRGDLYIFFPGDHVVYFDEPGDSWHYRWCTITGPILSTLADGGIEKGSYLHRLQDLDIVLSGLDMIEFACTNDEPAAHLGSMALFQMLHGIVCRRERALTNAQRAKAAIDSWSFGSPTVEGVATAIGVERSTLFRCFRAEYGQSVKCYVDEMRLAKAARLLRMTVESVKSIAWSCGYGDQLYFSRAFSKRYGASPTEWRSTQEV